MYYFVNIGYCTVLKGLKLTTMDFDNKEQFVYMISKTVLPIKYNKYSSFKDA